MKRIALAIILNIIADPISTEAYLQARTLVIHFVGAPQDTPRPLACVWTKYSKATKCKRVKLAAGLAV